MKHLISLIVFLGALPAFANLEVAAITSYNQTTFSSSGGASSMNKSTAPRFGALLLLPMFPGLSLRTGVVYEDRKSSDNDSTLPGVTYEFKDRTMAIPLNLQVGLPVTSLYLFGGFVLMKTQDTTVTSSSALVPTSTDKTPDDTAINVGLGYDFYTFGLFRLAGELESVTGTKNLVTSGSGEIKQSSLGANVVLAFGF